MIKVIFVLFFLLYLCRERIIYIDTHYFKYSVNIWMLVMSYSSLRCNCVLDKDLLTEGFIISALILYNPILKSEIIFQNSEVNLKSKWIRHSDDFRTAFMRIHIIESRDFFFPSSFFHFLANVCTYFLTFPIQLYEVESVINLLDRLSSTKWNSQAL